LKAEVPKVLLEGLREDTAMEKKALARTWPDGRT
jgi:hypothetical protein